VRKLLEVLHELVDNGNTVVVIEHNLEVVKDRRLDRGPRPRGGDSGGEIVASARRKRWRGLARSYTGQYSNRS